MVMRVRQSIMGTWGPWVDSPDVVVAVASMEVSGTVERDGGLTAVERESAGPPPQPLRTPIRVNRAQIGACRGLRRMVVGCRGVLDTAPPMSTVASLRRA
jgi:hypothetical protein